MHQTPEQIVQEVLAARREDDGFAFHLENAVRSGAGRTKQVVFNFVAENKDQIIEEVLDQAVGLLLQHLSESS